MCAAFKTNVQRDVSLASDRVVMDTAVCKTMLAWLEQHPPTAAAASSPSSLPGAAADAAAAPSTAAPSTTAAGVGGGGGGGAAELAWQLFDGTFAKLSSVMQEHMQQLDQVSALCRCTVVSTVSVVLVTTQTKHERCGTSNSALLANLMPKLQPCLYHSVWYLHGCITYTTMHAHSHGISMSTRVHRTWLSLCAT